MFTSILNTYNEVYSTWETSDGLICEFAQSPHGILLEIAIYGESGEEITFSIYDDEELQQGAEGLCSEGDAQCVFEGLSGPN